MATPDVDDGEQERRAGHGERERNGEKQDYGLADCEHPAVVGDAGEKEVLLHLAGVRVDEVEVDEEAEAETAGVEGGENGPPNLEAVDYTPPVENEWVGRDEACA